MGHVPKGHVPLDKRTYFLPGGRFHHGLSEKANSCPFLVKGSHGSMKDGELDRAKAWGVELAKMVK
jgi:hypothetical protein